MKRIFEIEASEEVMETFERFLALLHYNSRFGHSALFGMFLDGDGNGRFTVKNDLFKYRHGVSAVGNIGYTAEIANSEGYGVSNLAPMGENHWYVKGDILYKNGKLHKDYKKYYEELISDQLVENK